MVLRILKGVAGKGVSVETNLAAPYVYPGGRLRGEIRFTGGDVDQAVKGIALEFEARVDVPDRDDGRKNTVPFHKVEVAGPFQLPAGAKHTIPFEIRSPWETPLTQLSQRPLTGMKLGIATELGLEMAADKDDFDPLHIEPLPVQAAILKAVEDQGFVVQGARLLPGGHPGAELQFHQRIRYWAEGEFASRFRELEVTFITNSTDTDVVLQVGQGPDAPTQRFGAKNSVPTDFAETVTTCLHQLAGAAGG